MSGIFAGLVGSVKAVVASVANISKFTVPSKSIYTAYGIDNYKITVPNFDIYGNMYQLLYSTNNSGGANTNTFVLTKRDAKTKNLIWVKTLDSTYMSIAQGGFDRIVIKNSVIYLFLQQNVYCPTFDLDGNFIRTIKTVDTQRNFIIDNYFISYQPIVSGGDYYGNYYDYSLRAANITTGSSVAIGGPIILNTNSNVKFITSDSLNNIYSGRQSFISNSFTEVQSVAIGSGSSVYAYRTYSAAGSGNDYIYTSQIQELIVGKSNKIYALQTYYSTNQKRLRVLVSNTAADISSMYPITTITVASNVTPYSVFFAVDSAEKYAYIMVYEGGSNYNKIGLLKIDLANGNVVWTRSIAIAKTGVATPSRYQISTVSLNVSDYLDEIYVTFYVAQGSNTPFYTTHALITLLTDGAVTGTFNNTGLQVTYAVDSTSYTYTTSTYSVGNLALTLNSTTTKVDRGSPVQSFSSNPANLVLGSISTSSYDLESTVNIA